MRSKVIVFLWIIFLWGFSSTEAKNDLFDNDTTTIKELGKNIEKLKIEEQKLQDKSEEISKDYKELIWFIKDDLSDDEIDEITKNIDDYINKRDDLEETLKNQINDGKETKETKNKLINQKANFYRYIAKYVDYEKRDQFIEHIKANIQATKERKDLIEEILKNQNLVDKKVTYLKEKIATHKEDLANKIESSVKTKVESRIEAIDKDEKYKNLDQSVKNKIYTDFINQIKGKLKELNESNLSDSYKQTRSLIYNTMIENIQSKIKK